MARVLMVFEPPDGGVAENVLQLALHLGEHGHAVDVAGPRDAVVYERLAEAGIPVRRLPLVRGYGRPQLDAAALRALLALISPARHDLVHCHSAKAGVLGRLAARVRGVPAVYSPHSFPFVGEFGTPRRLFATGVEWLLGRSCSAAILCVCEAERRLALQRGLVSPARLRVVYNGCEPCDEQAAADPALQALGEGGPVAASVAVLRQQKRIDVLIDATPLVLERLPQARIAIVGDGPLRHELAAQAAARGLQADERFAFLPFSASSAHLRALDVFVLPSGWEAFPISVLEALACGVPQVATDVGGTSEALTPQTGVLVAPNDPRALADAIVALLSDSARREAMARAARARHAELFTLDLMVAGTAALYDDVVERRL